MTGILSITGTIFALIAFGYGLARAEILDRPAIGALSRFVISVALPALVIRALTSRDLGEIIDPVYLTAYLAGSLATLAAGYVGSGLLGSDPRLSTFAGMGMACSNSGHVGYPILAIALPGIAGTALALNMMVENLVMIPLVLAMAERAASEGETGRGLVLRIGRRLATNPILIAIVIGVTLSLLPIGLPGVLDRAVALLAESAAALALVVIGGSLVGLPFRGMNLAVMPVVAGKLLLHPLAVASVFTLLALVGIRTTPEMTHAAILMAAMPAMGIYPLLAAQYGEGDVASVAMLAMTVISFFTISSLLWLLGA